ncbi:kinase-like domain-containing protein [Trichoderma austrokoningii]
MAADTYDLQRIGKIGGTYKTSILSCLYLGRKVAAKVYRADDDKQNLHDIKEAWKREKRLLRDLQHPNIISLLGLDSRLLTLYLWPVLPSLDKIEHFTSSETETILYDMSSALAYLSTNGVVHYDVKPPNILYSPDHGAVLIDFDVAKSKDVTYKEAGGTPGYLPPETIQLGKIRGSPGDVWALGFTVLEIFNIIYHPNVAIIYNDLQQKGSQSYKNMTKLLQSIASRRNELDLEDRVQGLVHKMLEPDSEARATAAAVHQELKDDRELKDGLLAKKSKHS